MARKSKKESNFEFFNPNPKAKEMFKSGKKAGTYPRWDIGDCSIRAVCGATGLSWVEVYNLLTVKGLEMFNTPTSVDCVDEVLQKLGFKKMSLPKATYGSRRITVSELAKIKSDKHCVFRVASHLVSAFDGKYHDVWDCGDRAVYFYWEK